MKQFIVGLLAVASFASIAEAQIFPNAFVNRKARQAARQNTRRAIANANVVAALNANAHRNAFLAFRAGHSFPFVAPAALASSYNRARILALRSTIPTVPVVYGTQPLIVPVAPVVTTQTYRVVQPQVVQPHCANTQPQKAAQTGTGKTPGITLKIEAFPSYFQK